MRLQFSLRELLAVMAVAALGCGALLHPSDLAESFTFTFTIAFLFVAVLGAIAKRGSARMFWLGAAVAGWGYLWVAHWADEENPALPPWALQSTGPLLTTKLLRIACDRLYPPPPPAPGMGMFSVRPEKPGNKAAPTLLVGGPQSAANAMSYERLVAAFMRIGHCLWVLLFAYLSARLTSHFYRKAASTE